MSYTIYKSDGTVLTTIGDSTRDTTTSLSLAGPNFVGYGLYLNENLVHLLENFAANSAPSATNLQGQLWFDKFNQKLKVFTDQGYVPVSGVTNSGNQPAQGKDGDIWYNTTTEQLFIYDSNNTTGFKLVGPNYTRAQGVSGAIPSTIGDASISGIDHDILKLQFGNVTYAIVSSDNEFVPSPGIAGFSTIRPGLNFNSNIASPTINSNLVGNVTGNVVGNLTGNVVAATLSGQLTGNVIGNLTGNVIATTLSGHLTGNVTSPYTTATNFNSSNIVVTGGYVNNLANLSATDLSSTTLTVSQAILNNLSTANISATGGQITGLAGLTSNQAQVTNFVSSNVLVTGGRVDNLAHLSATTLSATNISTSNIVVVGGQITNITNSTVAILQATNFSSGNAQITGGSATGLTNITATNGQIGTLTVTNVAVSSGNVSNVSGANVRLFSSNIQNSTATTRSVSDNSTAIATTAFVHSVLPAGVILMWGGSIATIPTGWQLCNGSNGTPDLRDRFIVGAGTTYAPAATGGSASVTLDATQLPVHNHAQQGTVTTNVDGAHSHSINDPGHSHSTTYPYVGNYSGSGSFNVRGDYPQPRASSYTAINPSTTGLAINVVDGHTHSLTLSGSTGNAGGTSGTTQPHENRPPYYALCYIQKMF